MPLGTITPAPQPSQQYPRPHCIPGEPAETQSSGRPTQPGGIRSWRETKTGTCALARPLLDRPGAAPSRPRPPSSGRSFAVRKAQPRGSPAPSPTLPLPQGSPGPSPAIYGHLCPSSLLSPAPLANIPQAFLNPHLFFPAFSVCLKVRIVKCCSRKEYYY